MNFSITGIYRFANSPFLVCLSFDRKYSFLTTKKPFCSKKVKSASLQDRGSKLLNILVENRLLAEKLRNMCKNQFFCAQTLCTLESFILH